MPSGSPRNGRRSPTTLRSAQTHRPTKSTYAYSTLADSGVARQVVITPHPLNVETEMTLAEFAELLSRVGLIKTKSLKKSHTKGERVEDFLHGETTPRHFLRSDNRGRD